jgi:PAS domain S-box-containing protein
MNSVEPSLPPTTRDMCRVLDSAHDHIAVLDASGTILWANTPWAGFLGVSRDELVGRPLASLTSPLPLHGAGGIEALLQEAANGAGPIVFEGLGRGASGPRHMQYVLTRICGDEATTAEFLVVARDISTIRQELSALHESEAFFRLLFEHGPIGVQIASPDRRILRVNRVFAEMLGYDAGELAARRIDDLTKPEDFERERPLLEQLQSGEIAAYRLEKRLLTRQGRPTWTLVTRAAVFDGDRHLLFLVSLTENIEARKQVERERQVMEERLRERQKLESLGVLAGNIAHDLNNLLVPILGNAEVTLSELPAEAPQRSQVQEVVRAARRAALLAQQMLAYSGRGHFVMTALDLSQSVQHLAPVLSATLGRGASLSLDLATNLPPIRADASQIQQILLNLVQNAAEALADRGGTLVVSTASQELTQAALESLYLPADLPEGEYVYLRVADDGPGLPPEIRERLFDPFCSTKGPGRGLGLPAVLGIARGHGGAVHVESPPGGGTAVTVYFRAVSVASTDEARRAHDAAPSMQTARGQGTVLIVEDDDAVRALAARTLERAGYAILTADDGVAAVKSVQASANHLDCVLLDLVLPHLHGEVVCREVKAIAPSLPIVIMSGYVDQITGQVAAAAARVLPKPFTPQSLRDAVRAAIVERR